MLLLKDECALCKRLFSNSHLRRCFRCGKLYCIDCSTFTSDGYIICLNCARKMVSPRKLGTKYSSLSRYLLRRGMFTGKIVLTFAGIEGVIGDNLPYSALRDNKWWKNTRFTAQGRAWIDVGWQVENVDIANRRVSLIRVAETEIKKKQKSKEKKNTEFFKKPLRHKRLKRPAFPSKTKIALAQARVQNIERKRLTARSHRGKFPAKSAYEKRLFRQEARPSVTSD